MKKDSRTVNPLSYQRPSILFNEHLETIFPALFRRVEIKPFQRERIITPDDDFLDLDWLTQQSKKLVILSHGLEGNSQRAYIKGMAKVFFQAGYDVLAWNYRGCSEEMNKALRFYHSGATDDLDVVVTAAIRKGYSEISLVGFSLGGNLTLKYFGEKSHHLSDVIRKAIVFSVPLHLHSSCLQISKPQNWIYSYRFLRSLKAKVKQKGLIRKELSIDRLDEIKSLIEFDDTYTAPLHGFQNAVHYYENCSSLYFLKSITRPTLIVNALNDPFLSKACYPDEFRDNSLVKLETPNFGGHVGFSLFDQNGLYWSELRALDFITHD